MTSDALLDQSVALLQELIRFDTVNPPGNERPAIEHLERYLADAGFETEILAADPARPNLVATLDGQGDGPVLCLLGHVDTVLADASEWRYDPWSGELADGFVWGRGALDMKDQVAAEAVAAVSLAREGWRPDSGALKLVFVSDEETGGDVGAHWLTETHPDKVRCDFLLNEGAGEVFEFEGRRRYGVCCAEKGIFRFNVTAHGMAGHASLPRTGDNALLKLAPVLSALAEHGAGGDGFFELTEAPTAFLRGLDLDPSHPSAAVTRLEAADPRLRTLFEPMFGVTLTPTMTSASTKINVIPSRAQVRVDCRVPPGLGEEAVARRIHQVLGEPSDQLRFEFTEQVIGNGSPVQSRLMSAIEDWIAQRDPGATAVPLILSGFSDSRWFREAFPDCVAYGFFPQRHQTMLEATPLMHNADERIDVRDLGFATEFFRDIILELLG
jgi:acetylornithine deacetylase/succinyl-diaminopimelate desuccinylase-like protein